MPKDMEIMRNFLGNFLLEKSIEPRFLSNKTGDEDT